MGLFRKLGRIPEEGPSFRAETYVVCWKTKDSVVECKASENVCENWSMVGPGDGRFRFEPSLRPS